MRTIIKDYYKGCEGNGEIAFVRIHGKDELVFTMYDGYFDNIMDAVNPRPTGWTSLALYHHTGTGWNDTADWKIPDATEAVKQLKEVDQRLLSDLEHTILHELITFMSEGLSAGDRLSIKYS